ncbi:hypothetical protein STEG23_014138, partial [Scotinomys teguina]
MQRLTPKHVFPCMLKKQEAASSNRSSVACLEKHALPLVEAANSQRRSHSGVPHEPPGTALLCPLHKIGDSSHFWNMEANDLGLYIMSEPKVISVGSQVQNQCPKPIVTAQAVHWLIGSGPSDFIGLHRHDGPQNELWKVLEKMTSLALSSPAFCDSVTKAPSHLSQLHPSSTSQRSRERDIYPTAAILHQHRKPASTAYPQGLKTYDSSGTPRSSSPDQASSLKDETKVSIVIGWQPHQEPRGARHLLRKL